jgi:lipopolysaccharide transport system ATP-binding protein
VSPNAFVLKGVAKHFKKRSVRREYTTVKTELLRILTGQRKALEPWNYIEALKSIDLVVPKGRTIGIVGRNGSGKSTLLKLMTGIYSASSGTLEAHGRISALLDLGAGFHPDFTGRENILINGIILGMTRAEVKARMEEIIQFAELGDFIDEQVRTYSSGMFMRLAFAVATHVDPEILIIDEILAVGDEHFQRKSMAKMTEFKQQGKTIVLVTHDLGTVLRWCDLAAWIDGGTMRMVGDPAQVVESYRTAVNAAEAQTALTGSSALSAPGLALPASAKVSAFAPPAPLVRLERVRLLDVSGADVTQVASDARLDVLVEWRGEPGSPLAVTVEVSTAEGVSLFSTTLDAGDSAERGTARLSLARLGLGEGQYQVATSVHAPNAPAAETLKSALVVTAHAPGAGVLRPPHVWSLDVGPAVQARSSRPPA